ncbi:MAG: tRNA (adenosine(37)-N6)-threonylcarbamoyltransferase complex dimerization subunit type 1 TsaB [Phycisphaeraceae bacterium]
MTGSGSRLLVAIETSGRVASVAVGSEDQPEVVERFEPSRRHSVGLVAKLSEVFDRGGWLARDVGVIAVSSGPGSFTGLRVGFAAAQGLVLATGARVVVVPTAEVLAHNAPEAVQRVGVVLNSKGRAGYLGGYERRGAELMAIREPEVGSVEDLVGMSVGVVVAEKLPEGWGAMLESAGVEVLEGESAVCSAGVVYRLGRAAVERGHYSDPSALVPTYGREPEAVTLWKQRSRG